MVAYLAQVTDKTTVAKLTGVSWRTVGKIVERIVAERLDSSALDGLRRIGIDEFSYRKHHRYITTVVDHDTGRVVWAGKGKGGDTLGAFFDQLGPKRLAQLETITMDMAAGYLSAVKARAPHVTIVFDRFHVQALASNAVDKVRRQQWRELQGTPEGETVKKSRWALLKNLWNLSRKERQKLSDVQQNNKQLYRAYLLKEALARALDYRQPKRAAEALDEWLGWASRSRLQPFVQLARTIRKHKDGILAYVKERLTNGIVEGINNRLRMIARRAFGFHSANALMSMLFLCCGGISLNPPLPGSAH
jgi:transposase